MTSIDGILTKLEHHGARLERKPEGGVRVIAPLPLPEELLETIKQRKTEILEHLASSTKPSNGPDLLPAQSPWTELSDNAQDVWEALGAAGAIALHLIDETGGKCCHRFAATKPSDLRELAKRGLQTFPDVKTLTVIAVLPEIAVWGFGKARRVN